MSFTEGQWVRVRPEVPLAGGKHGEVMVVFPSGAMLRFPGQSGMLVFDASEITDEITITREAFMRSLAQAEVDDLAARTVAARERLREAVRAEIRAMPTVADAEGFAEVEAVLTRIAGDGATYLVSVPQKSSWWHWVGMNQFGLRVDGPVLNLLAFDAENDHWDKYTLANVDTPLCDGALKAALLWLADRDVFLPARSP